MMKTIWEWIIWKWNNRGCFKFRATHNNARIDIEKIG